MEAAKGPMLEKEEKEPKLKCHEMRLIFQRLPTSELIRFISRQPKHPLGKFWSQELKFVIEKRLPFSIKAATEIGLSCDHVIFDCNGSRVAEIKDPKQFHLSPVCVLIEIAEVPAIYVDSRVYTPRLAYPTSDILATLANMDFLTLRTHCMTPPLRGPESMDSLSVWTPCMTRPSLRGPVDIPVALSPEVMSRINSLTLATADERILKIISRATSLKKLKLPYLDKSLPLLTALLDLGGYYGLESLSFQQLYYRQSVQPFLEIITTRFSGLRELFLPVHGPVRRYLAAFQALSGLTTLGMAVVEDVLEKEFEKLLSINENDLPIVSVTELCVAWRGFGRREPRLFLAMLSKFPNVRTFGADFYDSNWSGCFLLQLASAVCSSAVFTQLQALKFVCIRMVTRDELLQFVRDNIDHLPSSVDLSQVWTARSAKIDRDFLVDLSEALQGGRITFLALKDLVHRDAVPRLLKHLLSTKQDKSNLEAKIGKVVAWIDEGSMDERGIHSRADWWPEEVSDFTDFRIEAVKTSGPLKGSAYKARISNWTWERERLFDDF